MSCRREVTRTSMRRADRAGHSVLRTQRESTKLVRGLPPRPSAKAIAGRGAIRTLVGVAVRVLVSERFCAKANVAVGATVEERRADIEMRHKSA